MARAAASSLPPHLPSSSPAFPSSSPPPAGVVALAVRAGVRSTLHLGSVPTAGGGGGSSLLPFIRHVGRRLGPAFRAGCPPLPLLTVPKTGGEASREARTPATVEIVEMLRRRRSELGPWLVAGGGGWSGGQLEDGSRQSDLAGQRGEMSLLSHRFLRLQATYATASNDLKGTKACQEADVPGLYNLALAIIDYRGYRVVAQSIIPGILQGDESYSLLYGSVDNGKQIYWEESFHLKVAEAAKWLHLEEHTVLDGSGDAIKLSA